MGLQGSILALWAYRALYWPYRALYWPYRAHTALQALQGPYCSTGPTGLYTALQALQASILALQASILARPA